MTVALPSRGDSSIRKILSTVWTNQVLPGTRRLYLSPEQEIGVSCSLLSLLSGRWSVATCRDSLGRSGASGFLSPKVPSLHPLLGICGSEQSPPPNEWAWEAILLQQPPSWPSEGVFSVGHRHSRHDFVQTLHQCPLPSPAGNQPRQLHLTPLPRHQG